MIMAFKDAGEFFTHLLVGNWNQSVPLPDTNLECLAAKIRGEDKQGFLRWLRAALQWNPADRPTAMELLYDQWMMKGLNLRNSAATKGSAN